LLLNDGKALHAGEEIKYIITDFNNKVHLERAIPMELIEGQNFKFDIERYGKLLQGIYESIIQYFKQSV
jgi:DNA polymerase-2